MNEEFKFRVYDEESKEYTYSDELDGGLVAFFDYCEEIKADAEQFIRMYDSIGVLIYEEDILGIPNDDDESECSIEMHNGGYMQKFSWGHTITPITQHDIDAIGWTIVGHTHQNIESSEE